jgi:hypothetical protein
MNGLAGKDRDRTVTARRSRRAVGIGHRASICKKEAT